METAMLSPDRVPDLGPLTAPRSSRSHGRASAAVATSRSGAVAGPFDL